ncbi:MAG: ATP-binding cassette domain-containing protein, partial [Burkholderiales bacterium]|nr:ATP-binding cassette domain-containing protein [Burkholderiales bacterium]
QEIAYFDQLRDQLDPDKTLVETISPGSEWVETADGRKHVMSYLSDFLFPPQRAQAKVSMLSGGERNRLLLARLFARSANVLVLDEPTNDLDIESLELLEDTLQGYGGTLLLVSHDRAFLDNVVTQTLVAEGEGRWKEYVGGYSDWLTQRSVPDVIEVKATAPTKNAARPAPVKKLSFKEQRELEQLPGELEILEKEQSDLALRMSSAEYHKQAATQLKADRERAAAIEQLLAKKFERWVELDQRAGQTASA